MSPLHYITKGQCNDNIFRNWKWILHLSFTEKITRKVYSLVNPTIRGGLLKPHPRTKIAFLAPFCDPNGLKKFDFSQISMTMPPILFWGLKMA